MTEPTPRPWNVTETNPIQVVQASFDEGGAIVICNMLAPASNESAMADARLIVKAVNCHDELVSALAYAIEYIENWCDNGYYDTAIKYGRAALDKVREQETTT